MLLSNLHYEVIYKKKKLVVKNFINELFLFLSAKLFETVIPQSQVLFQRSSSGMRTFYDLLTKVVFNEYDALLILEGITIS